MIFKDNCQKYSSCVLIYLIKKSQNCKITVKNLIYIWKQWKVCCNSFEINNLEYKIKNNHVDFQICQILFLN